MSVHRLNGTVEMHAVLLADLDKQYFPRYAGPFDSGRLLRFTASMPVPQLLAFVLCEEIRIDDRTGTTSLLGLSSQVRGPSFPLVVPRMAVFVALVNAQGTLRLSLRLVSPDGRTVTKSEVPEIQVPNPALEVKTATNMYLLPFAVPGPYRLQLFLNGGLLAERLVNAIVHRLAASSSIN